MPEPIQTRADVARAYAHLAVASQPCCPGPPAPAGMLAKSAGYGDEELADLPFEAVAGSYGCGNPLAFSAVRQGDAVLDLGCGAGIDVVLAARRVGQSGRVVGVDMTDEMVVRARRAIAAARLSNAEIRQGIIEALPVDNASVDWVISNCVVNLSPEKERVFAEIARVLKPGGRMQVSDLVVDDLPPGAREALRARGCCVAGALTADDYRRGLEAAGLAGVSVERRAALDRAQLGALIDAGQRAVCDAGLVSSRGVAKPVADLAAAGAGRVWVAQVSAIKPR